MKSKLVKRVIALALVGAVVAPFGMTTQAGAAKDGGSRQINEVPVANLKQVRSFYRFEELRSCQNRCIAAALCSSLGCS